MLVGCDFEDFFLLVFLAANVALRLVVEVRLARDGFVTGGSGSITGAIVTGTGAVVTTGSSVATVVDGSVVGGTVDVEDDDAANAVEVVARVGALVVDGTVDVAISIGGKMIPPRMVVVLCAGIVVCPGIVELPAAVVVVPPVATAGNVRLMTAVELSGSAMKSLETPGVGPLM